MLRNGYLANATPDNPGTLAVNLTSERVRIALASSTASAPGRSLGALLGYRLERGLHDRHDAGRGGQVHLRAAPGVPAARRPAAGRPTPPPGTAIEARRGAQRGRRAGAGRARDRAPAPATTRSAWPACRPPSADAGRGHRRRGATRLLDIHDALADLAVAEGVHQAVLGNADRAAATLDAYAKAATSRREPDVVRTPRSGSGLTHRVGLHCEPGLTRGLAGPGWP